MKEETMIIISLLLLSNQNCHCQSSLPTSISSLSTESGVGGCGAKYLITCAKRIKCGL